MKIQLVASFCVGSLLLISCQSTEKRKADFPFQPMPGSFVYLVEPTEYAELEANYIGTDSKFLETFLEEHVKAKPAAEQDAVFKKLAWYGNERLVYTLVPLAQDARQWLKMGPAAQRTIVSAIIDHPEYASFFNDVSWQKYAVVAPEENRTPAGGGEGSLRTLAQELSKVTGKSEKMMLEEFGRMAEVQAALRAQGLPTRLETAIEKMNTATARNLTSLILKDGSSFMKAHPGLDTASLKTAAGFAEYTPKTVNTAVDWKSPVATKPGFQVAIKKNPIVTPLVSRIVANDSAILAQTRVPILAEGCQIEHPGAIKSLDEIMADTRTEVESAQKGGRLLSCAGERKIFVASMAKRLSISLEEASQRVSRLAAAPCFDVNPKWANANCK